MNRPEWIGDLPTFKEVAGHFHPAPFYLTDDMYGGVNVEIAGGPIDHLVGKPVAEPHTHDVPEIYLILAPEKGGAKVQIDVEDEIYIVEAPATFYVPAGAKHRFLTLEATKGSYCLGILLNDKK